MIGTQRAPKRMIVGATTKKRAGILMLRACKGTLRGMFGSSTSTIWSVVTPPFLRFPPESLDILSWVGYSAREKTGLFF